MATARNVNAQVDIAQEYLGTKWHQLVSLYKMSFVLILLAAIIMVVLGVKLNQGGLAVANFSFAAVYLVIWAFFTFYPAGLPTLAVFGIGGLQGLPKDWSFNQLLREGKLPDLKLADVVAEGLKLVKQYVRYSAHVAYFMIVVFTVLGTWYIRNAVAVLPIFILFAGIGFWAVLSNAVAKWYYRITFGIILVSLLMFLYQGFIGGGGGNGSKESRGSEKSPWAATVVPTTTPRGLVSNWNYQKTLTFEAENLRDQKLCGVKSGERTFRPAGPLKVLLRGTSADGKAVFDNSEVTSFILVNGTVAGETLEVDNDGCVTVSFAHPRIIRETNRFAPQTMSLVFK